MYDMCTSHFSFWTMVSWSLLGSSCITCVHQIFPSELWLLGLYLVLHVWHVYIRSLILNYGFLMYLFLHVWHVYIRSFLLKYGFLVYLVFHEWHVYIRSFLLNYGFLVYLVLHVWHVYIRYFLLNYGFLVSSLSFMYDMCTSDFSF